MSITTFSELQSAVSNFLNRSDIATARINEFIALTESVIANGATVHTAGGTPMTIEPVRIRAMETSADLTVNAQSVALPTGFLGARRVYLSGNPIAPLDFVTPADFWSRYLSTDTGKPKAFTLEGDNILFGPSPDTTYTGKILYYKRFTAMSGASDYTALLTNAPNVYLYGSLYHATTYIKGHSMRDEWLANFVGAVNSVNASDKRDRFSGAPLRIRVQSVM